MMEYWNVDPDKEVLVLRNPLIQSQKDVKRATK
jgi:hypothetical protein